MIKSNLYLKKILALTFTCLGNASKLNAFWTKTHDTIKKIPHMEN